MIAEVMGGGLQEGLRQGAQGMQESERELGGLHPGGESGDALCSEGVMRRQRSEKGRLGWRGLGVPSDELFFAGALGAVGAALCLRILGRRQDALFVGQWAPTLLLVGLYRWAVQERAEKRCAQESGRSQSQGHGQSQSHGQTGEGS